MGKKALISVLVILIALFFLLFTGQLRWPFLSIHPHQAVPHHAALFFSMKKKQFEIIQKSKRHSVLNNLLGNEVALFEKSFFKEIEIPADQNFFVVAKPTKDRVADLLFITSGLNLNQFLPFAKGWDSRTFIFEKNKVFTFRKDEQAFSCSQFRNLLIFARHAYMVENAISQLKEPNSNICKKASFKSLNKQMKPTEGAFPLYINSKNLSAQFLPLLNPAIIDRLNNWKNLSQWFHIELPIDKEPDYLTANWVPPPEAPLIESCLLSAKISPATAFEALPDNLTCFAFLSLDPSYKNQLKSELPGHFNNWLGQEIIYAVGETLENDLTEKFMLLKTKDPSESEKSLDSMIADAVLIEDYQMFKIWSLPKESTKSWKNSSIQFESNFATVLEKYVLFSNSKSSIKRWLGKYLAGQTCAKNESFLRLSAKLERTANGYFYLDGIKSWQLVSTFLNDDILSKINRSPFHFERALASIQWENGTGRIRLYQSSQNVPDEQLANILWNASLMSPAAIRPHVFTNPINNEKEVLILDQEQRLYLISRSGRVLWQKQIEEEVLSDIYQIDLYNNQTGQFAFSTRNAIYVMDREGNNLDGFPIQLQVPASNGLCIVDFFQSNDYRFFIACENQKAYGFDERGSPIEGWRPNDEVGYVDQPILHFQAERKDFIVLLANTGKLRVYKKNGSYRFKPVDFESAFLQKIDFQTSKAASRIVTCDDGGLVRVCNLKGDHFKLRLKVGNNKDVKFSFTDLVGDNRKDYVVLSEQDLAVYYYKKNEFKKAFEKKLTSRQDEIFPVNWGNKSFIGTLDSHKNKIWLMDGKGSVPDQFPLGGSTAFVIEDLLEDGKPVVITGNGASVTAYALE